MVSDRSDSFVPFLQLILPPHRGTSVHKSWHSSVMLWRGALGLGLGGSVPILCRDFPYFVGKRFVEHRFE